MTNVFIFIQNLKETKEENRKHEENNFSVLGNIEWNKMILLVLLMCVIYSNEMLNELMVKFKRWNCVPNCENDKINKQINEIDGNFRKIVMIHAQCPSTSIQIYTHKTEQQQQQQQNQHSIRKILPNTRHKLFWLC